MSSFLPAAVLPEWGALAHSIDFDGLCEGTLTLSPF